jgi:endogenous inhibitor of DNA gyrase (YacG/DUF329 family)
MTSDPTPTLRTVKVCRVDGCEKLHRARGLCSTHYNQQLQPERHAKVTVPCTYCGEPIEKDRRTESKRRPFCDYTCRDLHRLEHPHRSRPKAPSRDPLLAVAGLLLRVDYINCAECGEMVCYPVHSPRRFCSPQCSRRFHSRHREATRPPRRRRHRKHALEVYQRDGWTCWLCGGPTAADATVPHPLAPTLDHLVPTSKGGTDDLENLATAHFLCNSRRGAAEVVTLARPA